MMTCCEYFIIQKRTQQGAWLDTEFNSKSLQDILTMLHQFQQRFPQISTRIQQRNLAEDRQIGRKVPPCC